MRSRRSLLALAALALLACAPDVCPTPDTGAIVTAQEDPMAAPPKPAAFWPLTVTVGVHDMFDFFVQGDGAGFGVHIAPGTYFSPAELAAAVVAAMTAARPNGWAASVGVTGRLTVSGTLPFELWFTPTPGNLDRARLLLGFDIADYGPALSITAPRQHGNGWYADDPVADDTGDLPAYERAQTVSLFGRAKSLQFGCRYLRDVTLSFLPAWKVFKADEGTTHPNEAIERLYDSGWARFRWWPDASAPGTYSDYLLDLPGAKTLPRERLSSGSALYSLTLPMRKYVP